METPYRLIRSPRKTLALEVNQKGEVLVRAPQRISQKDIDAFVESHLDWIAKALEKQKLRALNHPEPSASRLEEYAKKAQEILPARVAYFADMMGVCPTGVRITHARKRFGSCSPKNSLCFSSMLMQYPDEAIDYVVVHELAHIVHHDHSRAFWETVARYMPDYRERQKLLKQ